MEKVEKTLLSGVLGDAARKPVYVEIESFRETICQQFVTTFTVRIVAVSKEKGELVYRVGEYSAGTTLGKIAQDVSLAKMRHGEAIRFHIGDNAK